MHGNPHLIRLGFLVITLSYGQLLIFIYKTKPYLLFRRSLLNQKALKLVVLNMGFFRPNTMYYQFHLYKY